MEDRYLDDILINKAAQEKFQIPESLNAKRKEIIKNLPERKHQSWWPKYGLAAAVLLMLVTSAIFWAPGLIDKGRNIAGGTTKDKGELAKNLMVREDRTEAVKARELQAREIYDKNTDMLINIAQYTLNNERVFGTRPVILNKEAGVSRIQDKSLKEGVANMIAAGKIIQIYSLNDEIKSVKFQLPADGEGVEASLIYINDKKVLSENYYGYNYISGYTELGGDWYFYYSYFNKVKDEDRYRRIAWDSLSEGEKKTVNGKMEEAEVTIVDWNKVGYKMDDKERSVVISVLFHTSNEGLLGPIQLFIDADTRKVVGGSYRM